MNLNIIDLSPSFFQSFVAYFLLLFFARWVSCCAYCEDIRIHFTRRMQFNCGCVCCLQLISLHVVNTEQFMTRKVAWLVIAIEMELLLFMLKIKKCLHVNWTVQSERYKVKSCEIPMKSYNVCLDALIKLKQW